LEPKVVKAQMGNVDFKVSKEQKAVKDQSVHREVRGLKVAQV
jgi:hypothetical protein